MTDHTSTRRRTLLDTASSLIAPALWLFLLPGCTEQTGSGSTGDASTASSGRTQTKLALNWYPEVEHGGYVAAKTLGLFAGESVDVDIIPGGPGAPQLVITELAAGRIQFAVSDADNVVKARAAGVPVVALMAPMQNSPRCILVHKSSGFQKLSDIANIELAISESRPFALWMKAKLPLSNVTMVPFSGNVGEFLIKADYAQQAFVFSEPFIAKEQGSDPQVLMVSDIGFNPYASVLVTTEDVITKSPELVRSVVKASVAGWKDYLTDAVATNTTLHEMNPDMSLAALEFGAKAMAPLCAAADGEAFCGMTLERWRTLVTQIEDVDDVEPNSVKPEQCFTTEFLP